MWFIYTKLESKVREADLEPISIPFHRGSSGYFVAIDGYGTFSFELIQTLNLMHKYCSLSSSGERNQIERDLRSNVRSGYDDDVERNQLQLDCLRLEATKKDYVEWVEYAVSFDE